MHALVYWAEVTSINSCIHIWPESCMMVLSDIMACNNKKIKNSCAFNVILNLLLWKKQNRSFGLLYNIATLNPETEYNVLDILSPRHLTIDSLQGFSLQSKSMEELRLILHVQQQQHSQLSQLSLVVTTFQSKPVPFFSCSWSNLLSNSFRLLIFPVLEFFKISRLYRIVLKRNMSCLIQ